MEKRKRTLKRTIVLFWKGLTGIIAATAEWFTVILGMKDESKYGKFFDVLLEAVLRSSCLCLHVLEVMRYTSLFTRK